MFMRRFFPRLSLAAGFFAAVKTPNLAAENGECSKFSLLPTVELTSTGTPAPTIKHIKKLRRDIASKLLIVGDVHGCLEELKLLLKVVKASHPGQLSVIMVGDLVNKGPSSAGVLDFCQENDILSVRGNHDDASLVVLFRVGEKKSWHSIFDWTKDLNEIQVEFLCNLPYSIKIEDTSPPILVVHAGLIPKTPVEEQKLEDLMTIRHVVERDGTLLGSEKRCEDGVNWTDLWRGPEFVFYGHDAVLGLNEKVSSVGLDTGVVYGRTLTGALIDIKEDGKWTYELLQIPALDTWCEPKSKL